MFFFPESSTKTVEASGERDSMCAADILFLYSEMGLVIVCEQLVVETLTRGGEGG